MQAPMCRRRFWLCVLLESWILSLQMRCAADSGHAVLVGSEKTPVQNARSDVTAEHGTRKRAHCGDRFNRALCTLRICAAASEGGAPVKCRDSSGRRELRH